MSDENKYRPELAPQASPEETFSKAVSLHQKGEAEQAARLYKIVLQNQSNHAGSLHYLGLLTLEQGSVEEGISLIERSIAVAPNSSRYHNNYGLSLHGMGRIEEAISAFNRAIERDAGYPDVHCNLAKTLIIQERFDEAEAACHHALDLDPAYGEAHNNLGLALTNQSRFEEAELAFQRAIDSRSNYADAFNNLGGMYRESGELEKEIYAIKQALNINSKPPDYHYNLAYALLQNGNFEAGWKEHEWRFRMKDISSRRFPQPFWCGEALTDKKILVWLEQGIGDEVMFASMLPDLTAVAGHCFIECDPRLVSLFKRSFPDTDVIPRIDPVNPRTGSIEISYQVAAGSLGQWFRKSLEQFPKHVGYLKPDQARVDKLRQKYRDWSDGRLVVGLSWRSGSLVGNRSKKRTLSLDQWGPVLADRRIAFVNVQYGECRDEIASVARDTGVEIYQDGEIDTFNDLDGLAAQLAALDLTISIDNSTVHMAGALGRPTWVLLPFACDWRWLKDREESPWYPSLRLFRQSSPGDWAGVITRVYDALCEAIESRTSH